MRQKILILLAGMVLGAALFGGAALAASGITAQLIPQTFYVDGRVVSLTSCMVGGNNYVKLRDIGEAVGFNVYWDGTVQIESDQPYTGVAPESSATAKTNELRVNSYKGNNLTVGDRSSLTINPDGTDCTVTSTDSAIVDVESVKGYWVLVAKGTGTATVTVTTPNGRVGSVTVTVTASETRTPNKVDLNANMEIRLEMIRLINQVRRENGVPELTVNQALMNAAQDCAVQGFTDHDNQYECQTRLAYGYPHGFGSNLVWFTGVLSPDQIAQRAVSSWVNSSGHFRTMITERYDHIGVGAAVVNGRPFCYMFTGDDDSYNAYG